MAPMNTSQKKRSAGFTLIEIITAVGIISVLGLVVIYTINPPELLRQSRDSDRITDINTLSKSIGLYYDDAINNPSTLFMGTSSVIYISVPDPLASSTAGDQCQGLGMPALPSGYTYHCAASSTYFNVNGTGWVPINFNSFSGGNFISKLPKDPTNNTSSNLYYTYQNDGIGGFEVGGFLESQKEAAVPGGDGGNDPTVYEKGTNLALPSVRGLVGYWAMDEGSGSSATDYSGNNVTGTWSGSSAYYATGKVGPWAGNFDGTGNSVSLGNVSYTKSLPFSVATWIYPKSTSASGIINKYTSGSWNGFNLFIQSNALIAWYLKDMSDYTAISQQGGVGSVSGYPLSTNTWTYVVITVSATGEQMYINGNLYASAPWVGTAGATTESTPLTFGVYNSTYFNGLIDDTRIYDRALTSVEIQQMYNAEK